MYKINNYIKLILKSFLRIFSFAFFVACSQIDEKGLIELKGKRVFIAEGNISFILPDSTLKHSTPRICGMGPDCPGCSYYEYCDFYSSTDSLIRVSTRVSNESESSLPTLLPWRVNVNRESEILIGHYAGSELESTATVASDSTSKTVIAQAHIIWRGRRFYASSLRKDLAQRAFEINILVPDQAETIQAVAVTLASLTIKPSYLNGPAKPHLVDVDKH